MNDDPRVAGADREPEIETPDDRPANAFEAAWPFNADSPHVSGVLSEEKFLSIMLVDVTGLDWPAIAGRLETLRDIARTKEMVPVFVVDLVDFRDLVTAGIVYDTLPSLAANVPLAEDLDWGSYLVRRRHLLREKWRPAAIINLGQGPDWDAP